MPLRWLDHQQQVEAVDASVNDTRPSVPTGTAGLDRLLRRGGLLPGTLAILGGRTGTRKSTIAENWMVSMASAGRPVGLVGLDEQPWQYVVSLMSVLSGRSRDWVEETWHTPEGGDLKARWWELKRKLHLFVGRKPGIDELNALVDLADEPPSVLFVDYLNKLTRDREYGWDETKRIPRLVEHLAEWSTDTGVIVVALHQLNRNDQFGNTNQRNAGHLPVTLMDLKYGGEEDADIVFGTYRPAMDPVGTMSKQMAELAQGDRFDETRYWEAVARVRKHQDSTFLQLLKNRPGTHRDERGVELLSPIEDSLVMVEKGEDSGRGRDEADARAGRGADVGVPGDEGLGALGEPVHSD